MNNEGINYSSNASTSHNVVDAIITYKDITFKESYIVVGELLKARNVFANYDLRIMGNLEADSVTVLGNLYVSGEIKTQKLSCSKKVTCDGEIESEEIIIDDSIYASNIYCNSITAADIFVRESIDVKEKVAVEGNVLAGDGILGYGHLLAENIIATNYFDFTGDIEGNVFDLSEQHDSKEGHDVTNNIEDLSFDSLVDTFAEIVRSQVISWQQAEEDEFLEKIMLLNKKIPDFTIAAKLASKVVEYTYQTKINNLNDFLVLFWARNSFPEEVKQYDTIKLALDTLYIDAEKRIDTLSFNPKTVDEVVISLYIVVLFKHSLPVPYESLLDTIFSKIGPRYQTVLQLINK